MNERIKELAEQAGMRNTLGCFWQSSDGELERFAELVRADALEEAALICEQLNYNEIGALGCAAAMRNRARGEK